MDPRLMMKLYGFGCAAKAGSPDGEGGGGAGAPDGGDEDRGGEGEDGDDAEDEDEPEDDDDADDADDDDADDDEPEDDEGEDGDEDARKDSEGMGDRARKRIAKLLARSKDAETRVRTLEAQLEEAKRLGGDDGKAILAAAERSGILPGLMTREEAKAFSDIDGYERVIRRYEAWLDDHETGDEYATGDGGTMSFSKVERRVRKLRDELSEMKDEYGERRKELRKKVREIFEAGIEALKAKKPGGAKKPKKDERKNRKRIDEKPRAEGPRPKRTGRSLDDMEVDSEEELESYIAEMRRRDK